MARLPTVDDLGRRRPIQVNSSVATVGNAGATGTAAAIAGAAISGAAADVAERENDLAEAKARSAYLVDAAKLDAQRDEINDPSQLEGFRPQYDLAARRHAEGILDPKRREQFMTAIAPDAEHRALGAGKRARDLRADQTIAATNERLVNLRETALRSPDERMRGSYIQAAEDELTALERAGYIDATKAQAAKRAWKQDYLEEDVRQKRDALIKKGDYAGAQALVDRAGGRINEREAKAVDFFVSKGWSRAQAAGIVGNLVGESGRLLDPTLEHDAGTGIGIAGWRDPAPGQGRKTALAKYAAARGKSITDFETQLEFVQHELETSEGGAAAKLRAAKDPRAAAVAMLDFERPGGWKAEDPTGSNGFKNRQDSADRLALAGGEAVNEPRLEGERWRKLSDETATDIKAAKKANEDELRFGQIITGERDFNPYNPDDRKAVDDAFDVVGARGAVRNMESGIVSDVSDVAAKFSYVPAPIAEELSNMTMNGSTAQKAYALQTTSAILANSPNALDKTDNGKALSEKSRDFEAMTRSGVAPDAAVKRIDEMASPEFQARASAVKGSKEFTAFQKARNEAELAGAFDQGIFYATPEIGATPGEKNRMVADYRQLAEYHYLRTGDEKLAVAAAQVDMKRANGVSYATGKPRVMKYPPERFYPAAGGSVSYIGEQAAKLASDVAGVPIKPGDIRLEAVRQTEEDLIAKHPPRYALTYYREQDGQQILETVPGLVFRPDASAALAEVSSAREKQFRRLEGEADQARGLRNLRTEMRQRARSGENVPTEEFTRRRDEIMRSRDRGPTLPDGDADIPVSPTDALGNVQGGFSAP